MSESESDLDFESADEDANYDMHIKNNNVPQIKHLQNSGNLCQSDQTLEIAGNITETSKLETVDAESMQNEVILNSDNTDKESKKICSSVTDCSEAVQDQNITIKPIEKIGSEYESSTEILEKGDIDSNRIHQEKQRVTLRLEKKIQQKNHMARQNSVEKESKSFYPNDQKQTEVKQTSWGFSSWGTNLLSTAASSVTTFTNQVSQGIGTVLETVENTLGAPPPEELANTLNERKQSDISEDNKSESENLNSGTKANDSEAKSSLLPGVSSWTKVLESTGSKVLMSGLDTLELIGKKTIDIITESDPGLRKTRSVFSEGITLSQILREAKAEADETKDDSQGTEAIHYSQMFDEYQGLVHLEALEMLSKQSQAKMQRLLARIQRNAEVKKNIEEIRSICENIPALDDTAECENFEDFDTVCKKYILELNLPFKIESIVRVQKRISDVVKNYEDASAITSTPEEIYHSAICSLAEFTAKSMETFHKLAELILVQPNLEQDVEHFATNLTGLTTVMCIEINNLSSRFHHCLDSIAEKSEDGSFQQGGVTTIVTNLYVEASNSNKYIQDAFLLLVPVLQVSLLESSQ